MRSPSRSSAVKMGMAHPFSHEHPTAPTNGSRLPLLLPHRTRGPHPPKQRAQRNTEQLRGDLSVPSRSAQGLFDERSLVPEELVSQGELRERRDGERVLLARDAPKHVVGKIRYGDRAACTEQSGALHRMAQLPDVSGPAVAA